MKKKTYIATLAMTALLLASCSEKKNPDIIIVKKSQTETPMPKTVEKVGDYKMPNEVEWLGNKYVVEVERKADTEAQVSADGRKFYDNNIQVTVKRKDGSVFFNRKFTKQDFASYVDAAFLKRSVLLGITFVQAESNKLHFAASVGNPDETSDEFVPMILDVSNQGAVSISKDLNADV